MPAPATPIDSDLSTIAKDVYFVLEHDGLWSTTNLSAAGAATWTKCLDATTYTELANLTFLRVRVAPGSSTLVYVLAAATGETNYDCYCFRSSNGGSTWTYSRAATNAYEGLPYTMDSTGVFAVKHIGVWWVYPTFALPNRGDIPDPLLSCGFYPGTDNICWQAAVGMINSWDSTAGLLPPTFHPADGANGTTISTYLNDYFGVGNYTVNWAVEITRHNTTVGRFGVIGNPAVRVEGKGVYYILWNIPSISGPKAIDVATTNNNWLYIGLKDKIIASEDGGDTWFDFYTSYGANDVHVDPQLAGALYHWSTTGNLNLLVKQTLGQPGVLTSTALMTEDVAYEKPLRIARDPSSGKLWGLPGGARLTMRDLGNNTDQKTDLTAATGLHAYAGYKLIFCEATDVYISDDSGTTITAKKGAWAEYASGVNAHRMSDE